MNEKLEKQTTTGTVLRYLHFYHGMASRDLTVGLNVYGEPAGRRAPRSRIYHNVTKSSRQRLERLLCAYPGRVSVTLSGDGPCVLLRLVSRASKEKEGSSNE